MTENNMIDEQVILFYLLNNAPILDQYNIS